ncbi:MAG: autotransporter domain-containing protein [Gammaproteobacteria bacterium]
MDTASFTVTLGAAVPEGSNGLTVNFSLGGSATAGQDYETVADNVVVGPGQRTAVVVVTPIDDNDIEGDETVTFTLASGDYIVGDPSAATATIADNDEDTDAPQVTPGSLDLQGNPGQTVSGPLSVSDDVGGISVSADSGSVQPSQFEGTSGNTTYSFTIPRNATTNQQFADIVTVRDTAGNSTQVTVTTTTNDVVDPVINPASISLSGLPGQTVSGGVEVSDDQAGITVSASPGSVEPEQISAARGNVTYSFIIPQDAQVGDAINARISALDQGQNSAQASVTITVSRAPQASPVPLTLGGTPGQTATATLSVSDDQPGIAVSASNGGVEPASVAGTSGTVEYSFVIPPEATTGQVFNETITLRDSEEITTQVPVEITVTQAPVTEEDNLTIDAEPGGSATRTFTVSDDEPGISVEADIGTVEPSFIEGTSGTVTYNFPVPADAADGEIFTDTITVTDAVGNIKTLGVRITAAPAGIPRQGLTQTQQEMNKAVNDACVALSGTANRTQAQEQFFTTCSNLPADIESLAAALDQMAPDELSSQGTMAVEAADGQSRLIGSRLSALRGGATGVSVSGFSVNLFGQQLPQVVLESALPRTGAGGDDSSAYVGPFGIFINGNVTMGDKDSSFNEPGFDFDAHDITIGGDYRFAPELIFGAALGYGTNETEFDNNGGNIDFDAYALSLYGTYYQSQAVYIDGIVSFATNSYDTRRRISFTGATEEAVGDTDGTEFTVSVGGGYDLTRRAWTFGPYGRLTYLSADIDGYQESPTASGVELSLDDQEITSIATVVGAKAIYNFSTDWGVLSPQLNLEWEHEFDNDSRLITGRFVNDPTGTRFAIPTNDPERDVFNLGAGATATFTGGKVAFIFVESLLGHEDLSQLSITGGFRFEF